MEKTSKQTKKTGTIQSPIGCLLGKAGTGLSSKSNQKSAQDPRPEPLSLNPSHNLTPTTQTGTLQPNRDNLNPTNLET